MHFACFLFSSSFVSFSSSCTVARELCQTSGQLLVPWAYHMMTEEGKGAPKVDKGPPNAIVCGGQLVVQPEVFPGLLCQ